LISILIIEVGAELIRQPEDSWFQMVRWLWGLTSVFWAENAKNKCKRQKQQEIPFDFAWGRLCGENSENRKSNKD